MQKNKVSLKILRRKCHEHIDWIWKGGWISRSRLYRRLAWMLGIERNKMHISMFDEEMCKRLLAINIQEEINRKHYNIKK